MKLSPAIPQLPMFDIDQTEKFYNEILGFATKGKFVDQGFLMMARNDAVIHFLRYDEAEARKVGSWSSVYIYPENMDDLAEELRTRGAEFRYGPEDKPWGMYEIQIDDPCGTAVRFGVPISTKPIYQF